MRIKPGFGYWDVTSLPLGGSFHRAGPTGLELVSVEAIVDRPYRDRYAVDSVGKTADGRKVAFHSEHTDGGHSDA